MVSGGNRYIDGSRIREQRPSDRTGESVYITEDGRVWQTCDALTRSSTEPTTGVKVSHIVTVDSWRPT